MSTLEISAAPELTPAARGFPAALRPVLEPLAFVVVTSALYFAVDQGTQFALATGVVYALAAASLGVLLGWGGIYTFGHAAFFGLGAYATGLLKDQDLSPLLVLFAGAALAAVAGLVIGLLGWRIVAVEFAIMTLIVGQVAYLLTFKVDALQGDNGLYGIPAGTLAGLELTDGDNLWWYTVGVVGLMLAVLRRLHLSPYGASLNAVRDDPVKAAAVGLPVRLLRLSSFVLACSVAGLAGVLFAQQQGIVTPTTLAFTFSGQLIIMVLLGGLYHFWGGPIGAIVFMLLSNRIFGETTHATLVLGLILLFIVVLLPGGMFGAIDKLVARVRGVRS